MEEKIQINAVDMGRQIRDEQAQMQTEKSRSEIMAFFKNVGKTVGQKAKGTQTTHSQHSQAQHQG